MVIKTDATSGCGPLTKAIEHHWQDSNNLVLLLEKIPGAECVDGLKAVRLEERQSSH